MAIAHIDEGQFDAEVLKHSGRVLVDFYADWCPPCRALAPRLERFAGRNEAVKVVKVDTEANEELSERYQVRTIPTLIAFENGLEVKRAINPQSDALLQSLLE